MTDGGGSWSWPLFEASPTAMLVTDDDRRYRNANAAAVELLGVPLHEIVGRRIDDFTAPEQLAELDSGWARFPERRSMLGTWALQLPGGERVEAKFVAVHAILPGRHLCVLAPFRAGDLPSKNGKPPTRRLTTRERQVLALIARGATTARIAADLVVAPETARTHTRNILEKLGARTRAHAIAIAIRDGELSL